MDEASGGASQGLALDEYGQLVLHRGVAQPAYRQAHLDALRKRYRRLVVAGRTDHQRNHRAMVDIQSALLDQQAVHGAVEKAVIDHVVHVPVGVIVMPAGGDWRVVPVVVTLPMHAHQ